MGDAKANTFKFASEDGAQRFVARLLKRTYEKADDLDAPGLYSLDQVGDEVYVLVTPHTPLDIAALYTAASESRAAAGEPKRTAGPKAAAEPKTRIKRKIARAANRTAPPPTTPAPAQAKPTVADLIADLEAKRDNYQRAIDAIRGIEHLLT